MKEPTKDELLMGDIARHLGSINEAISEAAKAGITVEVDICKVSSHGLVLRPIIRVTGSRVTTLRAVWRTEE